MDKLYVYKAGRQTDAVSQAIETNRGQVVNEKNLLCVLSGCRCLAGLVLIWFLGTSNQI